VLTAPVPAPQTSSSAERLTPVSSAVAAGSVSVARVFPLLAPDPVPGGAGAGAAAASGDSVVLSCSYTALVSYSGGAGPAVVAATCATTFVTAEQQVCMHLSCTC
jgi:hypothetical protein